MGAVLSSPDGKGAEGSIEQLNMDSVTSALSVFGVGATKVELRISCKNIPKKDTLRCLQTPPRRPGLPRVCTIVLGPQYGRVGARRRRRRERRRKGGRCRLQAAAAAPRPSLLALLPLLQP